MKSFFIILSFVLLIVPISLAHEEGNEAETNSAHKIHDNSLQNTLAGAAFLAILTIYILAVNKKKFFKKQKTILFILIVIPTILITFYLVYTTIYLNSISHTQGPIHWHADYEIWNCNEQIELINPQGFSNKIGSNIFHEHNDNRIHVEGVVINPLDVSLKEFFEVTGGTLTEKSLAINTPQGKKEINNNQPCNNQPAALQVFVWKTLAGKPSQEKIQNFPEYIISPYSNIPPGDCIIIEFSEEKSQTEKLCNTYKIAMEKGELIGS